MKLALYLALALAVSLGRAQGPPHAPDEIQIGGREYVRLTDWAKANDLEPRWLTKDKVLEVTGRSVRLLLFVDSCEAQINGITVWLLSAVAHRNGTAYLARQDVQSTLKPILRPPGNEGRARAIKTICLDPGHGGTDPGYCVGGNREARYTLLLAQELQRQLVRAGFKVALTRDSDSTVELPARAVAAKRRNADLFVSLHFNAVPNAPESVRGTEVYCLTPPGACSTNARGEGSDANCYAGNRLNEKNLFLAYQVQKSLTRNLDCEDRGVRRARFEVLREAVMPAILIEAGFLSHPVEGRKILDSAYRREIARAIVEGLLSYKHRVEPGADIKTARR